MTSTPLSGNKHIGDDGVDDLFNYDADDPFRPIEHVVQDGQPRSGGGLGLGLDDEIDLQPKSRAPRVKLDEVRLLQPAGIPELQRRAGRLKFKGKGHEYSDANKLLGMYQDWVDDLFPKASFPEALAMIEKSGHTRQMLVKRMDWINTGRSESTEPGPDGAAANERENIDPAGLRHDQRDPNGVDTSSKTPYWEQTASESHNGLARSGAHNEGKEGAESSRLDATKEVNANDELDELLAELEGESLVSPGNGNVLGSERPVSAVGADEYDDDMEAMEQLGGVF
jgi:replication fork protection complex subunit Csm3/Swi3